MLKYRLESYDEGVRIYFYYPEGKMSVPGKVAIYDNGDKKILQSSKVDMKKIYAYHALSGIDTARNSGTVAWY